MKNLISLLCILSLFSCKKEETNTPEPNFIKVFISNLDSSTARYKFHVYFASDSSTFDTSATPDIVMSGIKHDLYNSSTGYYEAVKIDMDNVRPIYVIGYRTKLSDSLEHRFWFIPSTENKIIEIPAAEY